MINGQLVFDAFPFFNELELLDIRLNTLNEVVNYFVLVESRKNFQRQFKPLYFDESKHLFEPFLHKIKHIILDDIPDHLDAFSRDYYQKQAIFKGLTDIKLNDYLIVSDLDEIWNPNIVLPYYIEKDTYEPYKLELRCFYHYINTEVITNKIISSFIIKYSAPFDVRRIRSLQEPLIKNAGHHYSSCGGPERIALKAVSYAHDVLDKRILDLNYLKDALDKNEVFFDRTSEKLVTVPIDLDYPEYIRHNQEKFKHLIKDYGVSFYGEGY